MSLFQTGWFVESLLTQSFIIHIVRTNRIPIVQSIESVSLLMMSAVTMVIGIALPFTPVGSNLFFTPHPALYWPLLAFTLLCYVVLAQVHKEEPAAKKMDLMRKRRVRWNPAELSD